MHKDYLEAIYHNAPISAVHDRLVEMENERHRLACAKLYSEYDTADKILRALHEHIDSAPFQWAQAYMREAEKAEADKDQATKEWEANRRKIEEEYLRSKEQEIEEMRRHHSEK